MKPHNVAKLFFVLCSQWTVAQSNQFAETKENALPASIKYVDKNNDGSISKDEVKTVFDAYQNYKDKGTKGDLLNDVESTLIKLISYVEGLPASDANKNATSQQLIDGYAASKFVENNEQTSTKTGAESTAVVSNSNAALENAVANPMANFPEDIVTDRPDQTEAPALTPTGFFQIEIGAQSEFDNDKDNDVKTQSTLYNTTLWKYGVTKNFELRLITEYAADNIKINDKDFGSDTLITMKGFNPVAVGSKIALQDEKGIIPAISLITHLELPYFGSDNYKPQFVIPRFRFLFAHTLSDRFAFSYNLGAEWEHGTSAATGIYTASLGAKLFGNLSMFVEAYGFLKEKAKADNRLDGGFTYLLNHDIQLDCSGGIGLNENSPDYFISAGISFRFNAFNKSLKR